MRCAPEVDNFLLKCILPIRARACARVFQNLSLSLSFLKIDPDQGRRAKASQARDGRRRVVVSLKNKNERARSIRKISRGEELLNREVEKRGKKKSYNGHVLYVSERIHDCNYNLRNFGTHNYVIVITTYIMLV